MERRMYQQDAAMAKAGQQDPREAAQTARGLADLQAGAQTARYASDATEVRQPGQIEDAINKAQGICNLLENCNSSLDAALSRITGGVPIKDSQRAGGTAPSPSGDIGLLMVTLDRLYELASLNSSYTSQVMRL